MSSHRLSNLLSLNQLKPKYNPSVGVVASLLQPRR